MKRDTNKVMKLFNGKYGLPLTLTDGAKDTRTAEEIYGIEGEFFTRDDGDMGQEGDDSIIEYNYPPSTQPSLWCQWIINSDNELEWDGGEKFYYYTEWLKYLINNFFSKWDVILNGEITWVGEDFDDLGKIIVEDNEVTVKNGRVIYY